MMKLGPSKEKSLGVIAFATVLVAGTNTALAQTSPGASSQSAVAASAPPAAKGFGQVVKFNGEEITVAGLARKLEELSPEERKKAIDGMGRGDRILYRTWESTHLEEKGKKIDEGTRAAIAKGEKIDEGTRAAIAKGEKIDEGTRAAIEGNNIKMDAQRAAIERFDGKVPEVLEGYEQLIRAGHKLNPDDKKLLNMILAFGKPPGLMPRVKEMIENS